MADVGALVDEMFATPERYGTSYAVMIVQGDDVVGERYGGALPHFDRPEEPVTPETPLLSWSVAKSVVHAAVGVLVGDGRLDPDAPAPVPEWSASGDPRAAITVNDLLAMRDGLAFVEDYVDGGASDVIEMLFGAAQDDVAHYAADRPLAHAPGSLFNYSSGSSNIVARIVGDVVGDMEAFLRERLFEPMGMASAYARFDKAGTFIGSSYVYATARDWIRFGQCYLRDGAGVVTPDWVAHGRRPRSVDEDGCPYGAHWWILEDSTVDAFYARGYAGQRVVICPELDCVVARFGVSESEQWKPINQWCARVLRALDSRPSASRES